MRLVEYLASGKAVVATTVANEGVRAVPDTHLLQADGPDAFTRATIALLGDARRRSALGQAARRYVEQQWTWEKFFAELEADMTARVQTQEFD